MAPAAAVGNGHRAVSSIDVPALKKKERADGNACVLAIGTANPPNVLEQNAYADYYFQVTQSEHMTQLKHKFRRMCDRSRIRKRHMLLTDDLLRKYPALAGYDAASLNERQEIVVPAVPRLGKEAADKAVLEWGQPLSKITHLVFCSMTGMDMPGADYELIKLMGLNPDVGRVMLYQQGCMAGGTVLRIAKDIAENNRAARVLVVCCEIFASVFRGPRPDGGHVDNLAGQAVFGDGAAALIVGADPDTAAAEKALFELLWTAETIVPGSEGAIEGRLSEAGIFFHAARSSGPATGASADADKALANVMKDAASLISGNVEAVLRKGFGKSGMRDWNELFWIVHPGGPAIMDGVQSALRLREEKLRATREVLAEYGNMSSCCVLFIMDNMRKWSTEQGCSTTGEGVELGVLLGFGPGLSVETVVLKSLPVH